MSKTIITLEDKDMNFGTLYSSDIKKWFPNLRQERIDEYTNFVNAYVALSKKFYDKKLGNNFFVNNLAVYAGSDLFTSAENNGYKSLYYFNFETGVNSKERNIEIIVNRLRNYFVKVLEYENFDSEQKLDSLYTSFLSYTKSELQKIDYDTNVEICYKDKKILFPELESKIFYSDKKDCFSKFRDEKLAGNREAKKTLFKAMDFLLCYDIKEKNNGLLNIIDFPQVISIIGKSGVGKTMLITKAIDYLSQKAQELNKPFQLYKIDADTRSEYKSLSERQLKKKFDLVNRGDSINILLFEELDTKIFSRNNINQNHIGELTFTGTFLECLGGMNKYLGNYNVIATFNRMINCDPALKRRLMEKVIFMKGLEKPEDHVLVFKNKLTKGINGGYVKIKNWNSIAKKSIGYDFQGGDIKNICKNIVHEITKNVNFSDNEDYADIKKQLKNIKNIDDKILLNYLDKYNEDKKNFTKDYLEE